MCEVRICLENLGNKLSNTGTPFACGLMIGTFVISSFTLLIGFHTRLSMFVVTLFLLSMNSRIGPMGFGGLGFVGIVSVYGNLVPNLEAYSVDKPHGTPSKSSVSNLVVTICITIHLSVMYYVCGMAKYVVVSFAREPRENTSNTNSRNTDTDSRHGMRVIKSFSLPTQVVL